MKMAALLLFALFPLLLHAQSGAQAPDAYQLANAPSGDSSYKQRLHGRRPYKELVRGIGFLPGRMHRIEGLSLSIWTKRKHNLPLVVKGVNMDFQPLGFVFAMLMIFYQPFHPAINQGPYNGIEPEYSPTPEDTLVQIRGLDLRLMGYPLSSALYGLGMSGGMSEYSVQYGAAISVVLNGAEHLYGLQLGGVGNVALGGKGVQIGLFNVADGCDCLQFGLLNRNGSRLLPLANWPRRRDRGSR